MTHEPMVPLREEVHQIRSMVSELRGDIREIKTRVEMTQETSTRLPKLESRVAVLESEVSTLRRARHEDREEHREGAASRAVWIGLLVSSLLAIAGIVTSVLLAIR